VLFQTKLHDMELPSLRLASGVLHHNPRFAHHQKTTYHFFPWHCHNFYELQFFFCTRDEDFNAISHFKQRTLLIFNPLQPHSCEDIGFEHLLLIQFTASFLRNCISSLPTGASIVFERAVSGNKGVQVARESALFRLLQDIASFAPVFTEGMDEAVFYAMSRSYYMPEYEMRLNGALLQVLSEMMRMGLAHVADRKDTAYTDEISRLVEQIVTNPGRKISMQHAAAMTHMSYSDFSRNFKRTMGIGYIDFYNSVRVNESQNYLITTEDSISEIADRLGFGSASYFSRVFHQFTGCTPNRFRQSKRNG
jgi:AraC-like DNA-binding protein